MSEQLTPAEKASLMKGMINQTINSFRAEGNHALADKTNELIWSKTGDVELMARMYDIFDRGYSKDEAVAAIKAGEV